MFRTHTRSLGLLLAVCLTALTAGTTAPAFAVRRGGTHAPARTSAPASHKRKWKAPDTKKLVHAVTHAHTVKARTRAVDNVLKGVGVGVYTGSGKRVVGGFERGPHDIYLYDFEVKLIVDQLADKTMGSFSQLATQFDKAGIKLKKRAMTGKHLAKEVASGIKRLGRNEYRSNPGGVLAAVVRKLGQARHHDLAEAPKSSAKVLDPVQRILIGIDATRSAARKTKVAGRVAAPATRAAARIAADAGCGNGFGGAVEYGKSIGKMVRTKGKSGGWGTISQEIKDGIDGVAMAYSVAIAPVRKHLDGAFGTHGPKSAEPMKFQVKVTMRDDYNHGKPGCGRLQGYKMPKRGGIPGVPVVWTRDSGQWHLSYLGTDTCGTVCTTTTDADGIATFTFQPDDEYLPGDWPKVTEHGTTTASEFAMAGQHNILGAIAQATGAAKQAEIGWDISYHHPAGYAVNLPDQSVLVGGEATETYHFTGLEACLGPSSVEVPHPLKPRFGPGAYYGQSDIVGKGPILGDMGIWFNPQKAQPTQDHPNAYFGDARMTIVGETIDWTPLLIPIDFTAPTRQTDNQVDTEAQWVFTEPTMHAKIKMWFTHTQTGSDPNSATSHTYDVPVTAAQHCPPPLR